MKNEDLEYDDIIHLYECNKELFNDKLKYIDVELLTEKNLLKLLEL